MSNNEKKTKQLKIDEYEKLLRNGIKPTIARHTLARLCNYETKEEIAKSLLGPEYLQKITRMMSTGELETCEENSQVISEVIDDIMAILRHKVVCPLNAIAILHDIATNIVPYVCCLNEIESE